MTDIVKQLREWAKDWASDDDPQPLISKAADEIEHLRSRVAHLDAVMRCIDPMAREQLLTMGHQLLAEEANIHLPPAGGTGA